MNPYQQNPQMYGQPPPQRFAQPIPSPQVYAQQQFPNEYSLPLPQRVQKPVDQAKVDADAATLRKAMKGLGTDEQAIIQLISNRTNKERLAMIESYKKQFNRDLKNDLKSELHGHFEDAVLALFEDPITYDCISLKTAMKGAGTDEDTLIEILATRSNKDITLIKQKYLQMYG